MGRGLHRAIGHSALITKSPSRITSRLTAGVEVGMSVVCLGPKARPTTTAFPLWSRAFQIYMSMYLTQPIHCPEAWAMLKYIQTIHDLSERGSNWQSYDESFKALKRTRKNLSYGYRQGDSGCAVWWHPFQSKGGALWPAQQSNNHCFMGQCNVRRCRYQKKIEHRCKRCGTGHPATLGPPFRTGQFPAITQYNPSQQAAAVAITCVPTSFEPYVARLSQ